MGYYNLGSVATDVLELVPSVPSTISGLPTEKIAYRVMKYMEDYTGKTIGSVNISPQFQPALIDLTCSKVLSSMELEGTDATKASLGEFKVDKSSDSSISSSKDSYYNSGMIELKSLGRRINVYQAL